MSYKYYFDPFRYEGGAGAGGAAGAGAAGGGQAAAAQAGEGAAMREMAGGNGQQGGDEGIPDAGEKPSTHVTSNTLEDKRRAFNDLVNGEYKDQFTERMQQVINRRFKESKQQAAQLEGQGKIMQLLAGKYGVDAGDLDGLYKAINQDDAFFEEEAARAGLNVKQFKEMRRLQAETQQLREQVQQQADKQRAQEVYAGWMRQAEQVRQMYPGFDLRAELQNETFGRLLQHGIDVRTAYQVVHQDELMQRGMMAAANNAAAATARDIQSQRARPAENGASSAPAAAVKVDVHKMTKADRDALIERARRGEVIHL